ncbi:MFS transporter [Thermus thermamylovorans]|uniref:MFS transporter n=1 Tax=Thermus thermamylovorans TaxID=2509362 RepID=A0A4Q9AW67_9DEIN|nr:MFS transporter [Thermus thermamylovorans]TBH15239.1 MFS transporter [Thermus thermamylovorans]
MAARVFFLFTLGYFLSYFYRSANAVLSQDLSEDLGLGPAELGFMTSLFYLAFAAVQLPLGSLLDRFGPRAITPALLLVAASGSLVFALAPSFGVLALGRALIGVGMAAALMGSLKAFSLWFPKNYATVSTLLVGLGATGGLLAATPLALLKEALGWRGVFLLGAGVVVLVALLLRLGVRNTPPGVPWPRGEGGGGLGEVFHNPRLLRVAFLALAFAGGFLALQTLWAGAYAYHLGLSAVPVGNLLLLYSGAAVLGFLVSGYLADRLGTARVLVVAALLFALGLVLLLLKALLPAYLLLGFFGAFNILTLTQARELVPPHLVGRGTTLVNLFGIGGTFLLQWGVGVAVGALGYGWAFGGLLGLLLLALLLYLPLLRSRW